MITNFLVWCGMRFADFVGSFWKIMRLFSYLPLIVISWKFLTAFLRNLMGMAEAVRRREEKQNKRKVEEEMKFLKKEIENLKKSMVDGESSHT